MPKSKSTSTKLRRYLTSTRKPRVTLVGINWVRQPRMEENSTDVGQNHFHIVSCLFEGVIPVRPQNTISLMDHVASFFVNGARSFAAICDHLTVEWFPGDVAPILEGISCGLMRHRDPTYPTEHNRIHASNIPQVCRNPTRSTGLLFFSHCIGSGLLHSVFSLPLLKPKKSSFACSNVLLVWS
jgi:hypothetical protein